MYIPKLFLRNTIVWTILNLILIPLPVRTESVQPSSQPDNSQLQLNTPITANQKQPDFSGTGRPGRQTAGESRDNCPTINPHLTALIPKTHLGKTTKERPTFWFYVPYSPQKAPTGEFVLQDENRNDIYRIPFTLQKTPGFVSFQLPSTEEPLKIDKLYRWYFKLYCDRESSSSPIFVQGWVQRIAIESNLSSQLQIASPREDIIYTNKLIWYDALAHLANLRLSNPTDTSLKDDWNNLLKAKGVELELPNSESIIGSVLINKEIDRGE